MVCVDLQPPRAVFEKYLDPQDMVTWGRPWWLGTEHLDSNVDGKGYGCDQEDRWPDTASYRVFFKGMFWVRHSGLPENVIVPGAGLLPLVSS